MALPHQHRLRASRDFSRVYRLGKRASSRYLAVRALRLSVVASEAAHQTAVVDTALGISISRKVSKRAVVRNRIKRQIRAAIRHLLPQLQPGWHVVIGVRPASTECEYADFLRELEYLLTKLGITHGCS